MAATASYNYGMGALQKETESQAVRAAAARAKVLRDAEQVARALTKEPARHIRVNVVHVAEPPRHIRVNVMGAKEKS